MKKLNQVVYNKLLLQAEEAKEQKLSKLSQALFEAISLGPEEETEINYAFTEMNEDVYADLWKAATAVLKYHDFDSINAEKVNEVIEAFAIKFVNEVENSLGVTGAGIGPLEPKVLGQSK